MKSPNRPAQATVGPTRDGLRCRAHAAEPTVDMRPEIKLPAPQGRNGMIPMVAALAGAVPAVATALAGDDGRLPKLGTLAALLPLPVGVMGGFLIGGWLAVGVAFPLGIAGQFIREAAQAALLVLLGKIRNRQGGGGMVVRREIGKYALHCRLLQERGLPRSRTVARRGSNLFRRCHSSATGE